MKNLWTKQLLFIWLFALFSCGQSGEKEAQEKALQAGQAWLNLIDEGQLSQSWKQAGNILKKSISNEGWVNAARHVREPLGKLKDRKLYNVSYTTSLPNLSSGEYFVIQYQAEYAQKSTIETITMSLGEDGIWRCIGYHIN